MSSSAKLQEEAHHLLHRKHKREQQPLEACIGACLATLLFADVFLALVFSLRYQSYMAALIIGPVLCGLLCVALAVVGYIRFRRGAPARALFIMAFAAFGGTLTGYIVGERVWWKYTVNYYNYEDMASYVNVDPGVDVGQSFMDAGTIYFKEESYVLTRKALAFHNGATYCVAPIVRQPVQMLPGQSNPFVLQTVTGYAPPKAGTLDWWAVGTNCCGTTGTDQPFTCGDTESQLARSGLRLLNNEERAMYLLAVQQWSASTGLPVRHPIFFKWVKDPVADMQNYYDQAWYNFFLMLLAVFFIGLIICFVLMIILSRLRIRGK